MERALELGHEVVAVARRLEAITPAVRLSTRQGDVFDAPSMAKAIADTDVVISCIGPTKNFPPGTFMSKGIPFAQKNNKTVLETISHKRYIKHKQTINSR